MSKYTTGELAKLCGVTVRTVQYYDSRDLLVPSELSEGGRRLYSEEDLKRMKLICFLRDLDISINTISQLLAEEHPENVIGLLLEQQSEVLRHEIDQRQEKLTRLEQLRKELRSMKHFSIDSIGDIAGIMDNRKKMRRFRWTLVGYGIALEALEWAAIIWLIKTGIWWPFVTGIALFIAGVILFCRYYFKAVDYICPECQQVFKPHAKEFMFSNHTLSTRKLTCPNCGHKGFCVEIYGGKE